MVIWGAFGLPFFVPKMVDFEQWTCKWTCKLDLHFSKTGLAKVG